MRSRVAHNIIQKCSGFNKKITNPTKNQEDFKLNEKTVKNASAEMTDIRII